MDRFIECHNLRQQDNHQFLKSNMDRFIEKNNNQVFAYYELLKSNMDRFIVFTQNQPQSVSVFKIQYG